VTDPAIAAPEPRKALYGGLMAGACAAAVGCSALVVLGLGGGGKAALLSATAVGAGSVVTIFPALFSGRGIDFGQRVLFSSMARMLLILALALVWDVTRDLGDSRRAFFIATLCGAALVLVAEATVAIVLLTAIERTKATAQPARRG
jgi:hypothetical protein